MKKYIFFLFPLFTCTLCAYCSTVPLSSAEVRLKTLFSHITNKNTGDKNLLINDSIVNELEQALNLPGAFEYPFDSLRFVGKITAENLKVRILTWNIAFGDGTNRYFGFVLHNTGKDKPNVFRLKDGGSKENFKTATLNPENWYGCLVYEIVEKKIDGTPFYFFLGYRPDDIFITHKVIDVLWFNNAVPVFGKALFNYHNTMLNRIVFEYSAKVRMMLQWNKDMNMIVFDHLASTNSSQTGDNRFYGPDLSFDGLKLEKGTWQLYENIDARNQ
jgi:hypothetical protein